ncbi:hypothetical protein DW906_03065 [Coprobacillus sp. AM42-12AC]|nr:hypothetical protein DW906_03065 [Coprobacillus sp. AM42-12AC]
MSHDERIEFQRKKLNRQFSSLDKKTKNIVTPLIQNAAFMIVTLEELQIKISQEGITIKYQNGANQWGKKKSPEAEMYNTMVKNLTSIIKQLTELVPKDIGVPKNDDFDDFLQTNM